MFEVIAVHCSVSVDAFHTAVHDVPEGCCLALYFNVLIVMNELIPFCRQNLM